MTESFPPSSGRPLRVSFVIATLEEAGAERQLTLLATSLSRARFAPEVVAIHRGGRLAESIRAAGVPVTILGKRARFDPSALLRLRRHLTAHRPDIVHSWMFTANSHVALATLGFPGAAQVVGYRCVDTWMGVSRRWMDAWVARRAVRSVANSDAVARAAIARGVPSERLVTIPNGVARSPEAAGLPDAIRRFLGDASPVVAYVGRLSPEKCIGDLIRAFVQVARSIPRARLLVIGDGPNRTELQSLADRLGVGQVVIFTGHIDGVAAAMSRFQVVCLPSAYEGQSNTLLEAMAAGVPVVASDVPENQELVKHQACGLLVPVGDVDGIAREISRLLSDPALARCLGDAAQKRVGEAFSVDRMVAAYSDLYEAIVREVP